MLSKLFRNLFFLRIFEVLENLYWKLLSIADIHSQNRIDRIDRIAMTWLNL